MLSQTVFETLKSFVPEENIKMNEPMAQHTTFRIGGPVDCLIDLEDTEQLIRVQSYLHKIEIPIFVLGNGSNLLVSDKGYKGVVLCVGNKMNKITVAGNRIIAKAGALMAQVARVAYEHGLTGLEFSSGIPGTVGGGVVMNAGAYGGEMSQVVTKVTVVNPEGEIMELDNETMEFGYRKSTIKNQPFIVTEVEFLLTEGDPVKIKETMDELSSKRREKQPLEFPSAGSTFKRPEGYFAGELIMNCGLRGYAVGGAKVSDKHCGFLINYDNATASDVMTLIGYIQEQVSDKYHVHLDPEVVFLGEFKE